MSDYKVKVTEEEALGCGCFGCIGVIIVAVLAWWFAAWLTFISLRGLGIIAS